MNIFLKVDKNPQKAPYSTATIVKRTHNNRQTLQTSNYGK